LARRPELREAYDLVSARALAPLPVLLELTLPFVRVGGRVAAIKAQAGLGEESAAASAALRELGGTTEVRALSYTRSDGKDCALWLAEKGRPTPQAYPRREGIPERNPIGGGGR
jgi:16S rRNA (guanine527-N7)-methyltransferase